MGEISYSTYTDESDSLSGRYLTFSIEGDAYGIALRYVSEITGVQKITRVPDTPDYVRGVMNLRGKVVPLIDLRLKFGRKDIPYTERTCVIVVESGEIVAGLAVDAAKDVIRVADGDITEPEGEIGFEGRFIEGIGKFEGGTLRLLDLEKFLKVDESEN
jgi:purine-binding chemotaxis protein CheW